MVVWHRGGTTYLLVIVTVAKGFNGLCHGLHCASMGVQFVDFGATAWHLFDSTLIEPTLKRPGQNVVPHMLGHYIFKRIIGHMATNPCIFPMR